MCPSFLKYLVHITFPTIILLLCRKLICPNMLPGLLRLSRGINNYYTPLHVNESVSISARVFDLTCETQRVYKHGGNNYSIPDQFDYVDVGKHSFVLGNTKSFRNYEELRKHLNESYWGLWTGFIQKIVLPNTKEATDTEHTTQKELVTTMITSVKEFYVTRISLPAVIKSLTQEFLDDCHNLPGSGFTELYEFANKYGSDVPLTAVVGKI